jgi:hypothetical protein
MRRVKVTRDKKVIEKNLYYAYRAMPKDKKVRECRAGRKQQTTDQQKAINRQHAAGKLAMLIANNFQPGDWYLTMTTAGGKLTGEEAKKALDNFIVSLRRYYKRKGEELKYIAVLENLTGRARPHGHMLINALNTEDMEIIKKHWTLGRVKIELFGGDIDDCTNLAAYFKKEDVEEHSGRVRTSHNLVRPEEKKEKVTRSECYKTQIVPPKGYHVHKRLTWQGYTKDGYPCQHIIFVRD